MMTALGVAYVTALKQEAQEAEREKKEADLFDIKLDVFCYAIFNKMLYEDAVNLINNGKLTIFEIQMYLERRRNEERDNQK